MVTWLLKYAHLHVNGKTKDNWTPLHYASFNGFSKIINILSQHGADINARDKKNRTPLHWAAGYSTAKVVECLLKLGAIPQLIDQDQLDALALAKKFKCDESVQIIKEYSGFCSSPKKRNSKKE